MCAGYEGVGPDIVRETQVTANTVSRWGVSGDSVKSFLCWENIVEIFEEE